MNILHLVTKHYGGGAALAVVRLHEALLNNANDLHSSVLTSHSKLSFTNTSARHNRFDKILPTFKTTTSRLLTQLLFPYDNSNRSISIFPSSISSYINKLDIDLVHLHWLQGEFISIEDIGKIKKPIVWTLHDCWPLLSSFHYPKTSSLLNYPHACMQYLSNLDDNIIDHLIKRRKLRSFRHIIPSFIFL